MRTNIVGLIIGMLILGGCAEGRQLSTLPTVTPYYNPTLVWHATRNGMQTVIHGNPFLLAQAETDQGVIAQLRLPSRFEATTFKLRPADAPPQNYRLVLIFNPDPTIIGYQDACGDLGKVGLGKASEAIFLHAAFCIGTRVITELEVVGAGRNPSDPGFARFLQNAIEELLPAYGTSRQFGPGI